MNLKNFTLLLLAAILSINTFSQPTITKQKDIGGSSNDYLACMDLTKDGGLIIGGYSNSNKSHQKTEDNKGEDDYWIVKLDSLQHTEWDKTIGAHNADDLGSIKQTNDGGYILGGQSESNISGDKTENSKGLYDYWIVKIDKNGIIQWDKTIGGNEDDYFSSIEQTSDDGYIVGGISFSDSSGDKTENRKGSYDYWVVKLDRLGNIQWDKTVGGNGYDQLSTIQQTEDGGYILGGQSESNISGDKTQNSKGGADYWIVKLSNTGDVQWDKTLGGNKNDYLYTLQQTSGGGYIFGGMSYSDSSGDKTEDRKGSYDYWVIKLNNSHHVEWDKTIGGKDIDHLTCLQQTTDSGYILGGYSSSQKSGDKTENSRGDEDYWIVKLNKSGVIQWDKTIGGTNYDNLIDIKETRKNHYILGGYSISQISGDKIKKLRGKYDYWIVYLDYTIPGNNTGIVSSMNNSLQNATTSSSKNFFAYPNPVKDILYVQSKNKTNFTLTDQSGKILLTQTINGTGKINVSKLTLGLYYLKNNETGLSQKIIVFK